MIRTADHPKRVWILGAGFSRPLGGPLLADLLSLTARASIAVRYGMHLPAVETEPVFWLYHYGSDFAQGPIDPTVPRRGQRLWADAEEFLETLDAASRDQAIASQLSRAWEEMKKFVPDRPGVDRSLPPIEKLAGTARRVVAAACSVFVEGVTDKNIRTRERWLPYLQWLGLLREMDAILTFNYDRVVEMLLPEVVLPTDSGGVSHLWGVHVKEVEVTAEAIDKEDEARLAQLPLLLKLHGSVDWRADDKGLVRRDAWSPALLASGSAPLIATPGESKLGMARDLFGRLWKHARTAISDADEIILIGLRLPESDAFPRDQLLGAIAENKKPNWVVRVVLGDDINGPAVRRLTHLLQWTLGEVMVRTEPTLGSRPSRCIVQHPIWAQDFLSVWARQSASATGFQLPR